MELNKDSIPYVIIAALLGTGGGTGISTVLNQHTHPELKEEIREVYYEVKLDMVKADIAALKRNEVDEDSHEFKLKAEEEIYLQNKLQDLKR